MKHPVYRGIMVFLLVTLFIPMFSQTVTNVNGIRYLIEGDNAIIGRQDKELDGDIAIPESIVYDGKSYSVTGLVSPTNITCWSSNTVTVEGGAFQDCGIKSIVLPNTIKFLSAGAFNNCRELTSVVLPASVESLGAASFAGCSKLAELNIPESVKNFGSDSSYGFASYVFGGCSNLKKINIPSAVTTLAGGCFMNCGLDSLFIPETIQSIEEKSLYIPNLKSLTVAIKDIRTIHYSLNSFADVSATKLYVPKGSINVYQEYEPWSNFMLIQEFGDDGEIIIPDQLTVVIDGIKYVLKDSCATIGRQSSTLDGDVVIPEYVEYDGAKYYVNAIIDCRDLTSYSGGSVSCVGGAFQNTKIKSIVLPNSIRIIPAGAFQGCSELESITLPNALTQLGAASLAGCIKLSEIYLPETLKHIASNTDYGYISYTFGGCSNLKSIVIPEGVTQLASGCFMNSGIESIVIPQNLTTLSKQCLKTNTIKTLKICVKDMDRLSYSDDCFGNLSDCDLIVPLGSKQVYQEYYPWINCKSITEYDDGSEPFVPTKQTVRINGIRYILNNGIATIGRQNKDLSGTIVIPNRVTYNGKSYTIKDMIAPTDIIAWSSNSVSCTNGAFQECLVDTLVLPNTIEKIPAGAFNGCRNLTYIQLPAYVTQLGTACFAGCSSLEEVFLPETITSFGSYTRYGFKSYIFGGCSSLRKVNMPKGIQSLAEGSFKGSGLEVFLISSNIKNLQEDCFDASNLKAIKITHKDLTQLTYTESCFANVHDVDLYVPEGSAALYKEFYPWKNFRSITEYVDQNDEYQYNTYKISFDFDGGECSSARKVNSRPHLAMSQNIEFYKDYIASGVEVSEIPTPVKAGYTFVGWDKEIPEIMPAENVSLTAQWVVDSSNDHLGDVNEDNVVNVTDAVELINTILADKTETLKVDICDKNGDGEINVSDVIEIINYILKGNEK